ncbi:MAG: hypothetical protein GXY07_16415 [Candidatus Hydrogenedentes bacterium]|nr:hypothetical protein [Candidatus Hydrogenedentota bacterium]
MRNRLSLLILLSVVLIAVSGCNTFSKQPQITRAAIDPPVLKPGDSAVITLAVKDRHKIVERIEGVVLEDPRLTFKLRDDGQDPDEKADDKVWSMRVDVPFQAPPGEFRLEFTAFDEVGTPISVRDEHKRVVPLQQVLLIKIEYPPQQ